MKKENEEEMEEKKTENKEARLACDMWGQSHIGKERRKVKLFGRVGLRLYDFWKKFSIKAIVSLATKQSSLILRNQFLLFLGESLSHGYFSLGYYGSHYQLLNLLSPVR